MKKTMKKTAAALCIAATLVSVAAPAMAVSPAEYMSTAALEECNTATVAQVESLINQIGTVTTARRPAIVAAVNAYNELTMQARRRSVTLRCWQKPSRCLD